MTRRVLHIVTGEDKTGKNQIHSILSALGAQLLNGFLTPYYRTFSYAISHRDYINAKKHIALA